MKDEIKRLPENGISFDDDGFCNYVIENGNKLLYIYYHQNKNDFPDDIIKFTDEHEFIMNLCEMIQTAHNFLKERNENDNSSEYHGRRWQVHPIHRLRETNGFYTNVVLELKKYAEKFKHFTRMSIKQFDFLVKMVSPLIKKSDLFRKSITPEIRVLVTLTFLSTGQEYSSIALEYLMGKSTVQSIVPETCNAMWEVLGKIYIKWPSDLEAASNDFEEMHKFPHCIGALDGKLIRIQKPSNSGGLYYNYKGYHSIVLMAICDADTNFIYTNIGAYGSQSDGNVWAYSELGRTINSNNFLWPEDKVLTDSNVPFNYFLIGDEAFPQSKHLLRPYSGRDLPEDKRYFNERLATPRNVIERTFGILANRFRIFRGEIIASPSKAQIIVKAAVVLHNYIKMTSDDETPKITFNERTTTFDNLQIARGRQNEIGIATRDIYKDYLFSHRQ